MAQQGQGMAKSSDVESEEESEEDKEVVNETAFMDLMQPDDDNNYNGLTGVAVGDMKFPAAKPLPLPDQVGAAFSDVQIATKLPQEDEEDKEGPARDPNGEDDKEEDGKDGENPSNDDDNNKPYEEEQEEQEEAPKKERAKESSPSKAKRPQKS